MLARENRSKEHDDRISEKEGDCEKSEEEVLIGEEGISPVNKKGCEDEKEGLDKDEEEEEEK